MFEQVSLNVTPQIYPAQGDADADTDGGSGFAGMSTRLYPLFTSTLSQVNLFFKLPHQAKSLMKRRTEYSAKLRECFTKIPSRSVDQLVRSN